MAAAPMSKSKVITYLSEEAEVSKKQAAAVLDALTELAHKEAKKGFTIPGLGKLVVVNRKARMGRNPATGESIKIPAKKVLKFRVAKAARTPSSAGSGSKRSRASRAWRGRPRGRPFHCCAGRTVPRHSPKPMRTPSRSQ